jgi:hypothetical protein
VLASKTMVAMGFAAIQACPFFHFNKITHINKSRNVKAHHQARFALRFKVDPQV